MSTSLNAQRGMALLASLVFMLLLSLTGLSSMVSATRQEKLAAGIQHANQSFQAAEAALRSGESWLQNEWGTVLACSSPASCNPPVEARTQARPVTDLISGVRWVSVVGGLYGVQSLGPSITPAHLPVSTTTRFYRVTGIGLHGQSRTVLESIYALYQEASESAERMTPLRFRRVMWRQLQ